MQKTKPTHTPLFFGKGVTGVVYDLKVITLSMRCSIWIEANLSLYTALLAQWQSVLFKWEVTGLILSQVSLPCRMISITIYKNSSGSFSQMLVMMDLKLVSLSV